MRIRNIIGAGLIAGAGLLSTACRNDKVEQVFEDRQNVLETVLQDKPKKEVDNMIKPYYKSPVKIVYTQNVIDSTAFSDIFRASEKAKDSVFIADYNKMISQTKLPRAYSSVASALNSKLEDVLNLKEMKQIEKNSVLPENGGKGYFESGKQFLVDSVYHHKLFEKHGLLKGEGMKKFTEICKKVRP